MQLNLRMVVYHVPDYVTTYYQQQAVVEVSNGRRDSPRRSGVGTFILVVLPPSSNTSTAIPQKLNVKSNKRRDLALMRLSSSGPQSTSRKEPPENTTTLFSPPTSALENKHLSLRFDDRIPFGAYVRVSYSLCLVCCCTYV